MVGLTVDYEADEEQEHTDNKTRVGKPLVGIASGERKDVATVQICIHSVEQNPYAYDSHGHTIIPTAQAERIYESPVYIMRFPHNQENQSGNRHGIAAQYETDSKYQWRRKLHDYPAQPVIQRRTPTTAAVTTIRRHKKKQGGKNS